jgi:hypothetical protein
MPTESQSSSLNHPFVPIGEATWKEPPLARIHRFKESPEFPRYMLLKKTLGIIPLSFLTGALIVFSSRGKSTMEQFLIISLMFSAVVLTLLLFVVGWSKLANCFEATYLMDEKGINRQRAGFNHFVPWQHMTHLEIVAHPALEQISLLIIRSRENRPMTDRLPLKVERFLDTVKITGPSTKDEIPFENGQIDTAFILDNYRKHQRKK